MEKIDIKALIESTPNASATAIVEALRIYESAGKKTDKGYGLAIPYSSVITSSALPPSQDARRVQLARYSRKNKCFICVVYSA